MPAFRVVRWSNTSPTPRKPVCLTINHPQESQPTTGNEDPREARGLNGGV